MYAIRSYYAEVMKRIWDPFFTTKEQGKGTGLGLAISQNIIRTLGGSIDVESKAGEGTVFTVKVPIKSMQQDK